MKKNSTNGNGLWSSIIIIAMLIALGGIGIFLIAIIGSAYLFIRIKYKDGESYILRNNKYNEKYYMLNMSYTKDSNILERHERCRHLLDKLREKEDIHKILGDKPEQKYEKVLSDIYMIYKKKKFTSVKKEILNLLEELEKYLHTELLRYEELEERNDEEAKEIYRKMIDDTINELEKDIEYSKEFRGL